MDDPDEGGVRLTSGPFRENSTSPNPHSRRGEASQTSPRGKNATGRGRGRTRRGGRAPDTVKSAGSVDSVALSILNLNLSKPKPKPAYTTDTTYVIYSKTTNHPRNAARGGRVDATALGGFPPRQAYVIYVMSPSTKTPSQ